jgi:NAD(P)-dependent dehydrogenase (short-subunit alcohol dehydrogenase family)
VIAQEQANMELEGRTALITGGSRGLGRAIAVALATRGAAVACMARPGAELDSTVAALRKGGARALAVPADVTHASEVEAGVRSTISQLGGLDIVVLNAGTWKGAPVHETTEETWDFLLDLNLKGAFLALKYSLPHLLERRRGTIIGISSLGGWVGQPGSAAYAAAKWGLRGLLESVALEVKPAGVRVSIVAPHNLNSAGRAIDPASDERRHTLETSEVAELVAHICSAPAHVAIGNVTIWPVGAGIRSDG